MRRAGFCMFPYRGQHVRLLMLNHLMIILALASVVT
jgi:hypothetical protein